MKDTDKSCGTRVDARSMTPGFMAMRAWRDGEAEKTRDNGAEMMGDLPDDWFPTPHFFCPSGHVSRRVLLSETKGNLCLACREPVLLGPPMTEDDFTPIAASFATTGL